MNAPPPLVQLSELAGLTAFTHHAMATAFTLHLAAPADVDLRAVAAEVFRLLDHAEDKLSFYREASDVSRLNRAAPGDSLVIDELTCRCLLTAMDVEAVSGGRFDPFAGEQALAAKGQPIPAHLADLPPNDDAPVVDRAQPAIAIDPATLRVTKFRRRGWLDLGAVGKGAALDAIAPLLADWNVTSAVLVAGGSSVLVLGAPPDGPSERGWLIRFPQVPGRPQLHLAAPFALGASGDDFQPGHIVARDEAIGRPRALVLAPDAALADALSTAAMLMPDADIIQLSAQEPAVAAFAENNDPSLAACVTGVLADALPPPPDVALVIPCWCESRRLPGFLTPLCESVTRAKMRIEIIVVDDGSPAHERAAVAETVATLRKTYAMLRPLVTIAHAGKGAAIRAGWQHASDGVRWLGFVDADGAVPPAEVVRVITTTPRLTDVPCIVAASRYHTDENRRVARGFWRRRSGGWFARWARERLGLAAEDVQCGFKLVPASWWRSRRDWREDGYAFDLELLLAAREDGLTVRNPAITWQAIGGSRVRLKDGLDLVQTVRRLARARRIDPPRDTARTRD